MPNPLRALKAFKTAKRSKTQVPKVKNATEKMKANPKTKPNTPRDQLISLRAQSRTAVKASKAERKREEKRRSR